MYYLGIDLGGTNVKAGVVDQDGVILSKISTPTHVPCAPEEMNGQLVKAAAAALEEQASRLTEAVAVFRIQQQQQQQRETSAVVKTVMPAAPRKMAVADSGENWETF